MVVISAQNQLNAVKYLHFAQSWKDLCAKPALRGNKNIGAIRFQSLQDTALSIGARGGLAFRSCELNKLLLRNEKLLNRVFNFNAMLLDKNVLPPVLNRS